MWWRIVFISLAYFLLGAHFLRYGQIELCIAYGLGPILLFLRTPWLTRLVQGILIISAIMVWGISSYEYVQMRLAVDAPWIRLAVIMSAVILLTLFAAWCCGGIVQKQKQKQKHLFH